MRRERKKRKTPLESATVRELTQTRDGLLAERDFLRRQIASALRSAERLEAELARQDSAEK